MKLRPTTIFLSGEMDRQYEGIAASAITPGMLIAITGPDNTPLVPGRAKVIAPHNVAGGAGTMFAREMDLTGSSIDDAYEEDDTVLYLSCQKGDRVFGFLAAGENVSAGDYLQSNGDGYLAAVAAGGGGGEDPVDFPGIPLVVALEDMNNDPGTGGAAVRIKVEVL